MQLVKTAIAAAIIGLVSTGAALAQENLPPPTGVDMPLASTGNGGMALYAYTDTASLTVYLGLDVDSFLPAAASPDAGRSINFGTLPGWVAAFGADNAAVRWHVTAADQTNTSGTSHLGRRLLTTAAVGTDLGVGLDFRNAAMTAGINNIQAFTAIINDDANCPTGSPCATLVNTDPEYAGRMGSFLGNPSDGTPALPFGNTALVNNSMEFYLIAGGDSPGGAVGGPTEQSTRQRYQNSIAQAGLFALTSTGGFTWNQAVVPIPAAIWLMLSGLAGLGVVGRRRTATTAAA